MIKPAISLFCVRALNCLQNSMILTWAWPRAGPTGGAGVALPASICSFTWVCTFLTGGIAITFLNYLFYLAKLEFYRGRAAKNGDHHLQGFAVFVHLVDHAVEVGERPIGDADRFVLLKLDLHPRLICGNIGAEEDRTHLLLTERNRLVSRAQKPCHPRRILHHVPEIVVQIHLYQHITGEKDPFDGAFLPVEDLGDRFGRDHHPANPVLQSKGFHSSLDRLLHFALKPRVRVNDVPLETIVCRWREPFYRAARRDFGPLVFFGHRFL